MFSSPALQPVAQGICPLAPHDVQTPLRSTVPATHPLFVVICGHGLVPFVPHAEQTPVLVTVESLPSDGQVFPAHGICPCPPHVKQPFPSSTVPVLQPPLVLVAQGFSMFAPHATQLPLSSTVPDGHV